MLTLTNRADLPLTFTLRSTPPFTLDSWEHTLQPGDACHVQVATLCHTDTHTDWFDRKKSAFYPTHKSLQEQAMVANTPLLLSNRPVMMLMLML
jgi:hypothetical protein